MTRTPVSRRRFVTLSSLAISGAIARRAGCGAETPPSPLRAAGPDGGALPVGAASPALPLPHYPSRVHAFVWRNWPLVPVGVMADVLGTSARNVRQLGRSMGLGRPPRIREDQRRRSYISVIKRNWHLLPYDQLLALLGWSAAELAHTLREDDFLWVKLGSLKPGCEPLRWPEMSSRVAIEGGNEIARIIRAELNHGFHGRWDAMFSFVGELSRPPEGPTAGPGRDRGDLKESEVRQGPGDPSLRFCYSYFALYGDPLLDADMDPYPDGYLARLAERGVTGVWLQGILYQLAPFPWQSALSRDHRARLENLRHLVARARRHGIRVFLYLNEPRAMPAAFFVTRSQLKGVTEGEHATLCTSHPPVRDYLADAVASLCEAVPDLGGFFTITASENLTHCWSHGQGGACSRCAARGPAVVIAEVNATFQRGIERAGNGQVLIAWDWGWADAWAPDAITRLPAQVSLMSVSEWSLPLHRGGVDSVVGEYSLSAIGPGPRAIRHWDIARRRGLKVFAKIQANNTWELSALPYLPVARNVAEHASNLRRHGLDGIMLGWTLGGYPSPNLETVAAVMAGRDLRDLAERWFGRHLAPAVLEAWNGCSEAFREFPYHIGVVYTAPLQSGPSNLLWAEPTRYSASMVGFAYDHLDAWRGPYPPEVFAAQLTKVAAGFRRAADQLLTEIDSPTRATKAQRTAARAEAMLARAAAIHFQSVAHQARFITLRGRLHDSSGDPERREVSEQLRSILQDELRLARELFDLQTRDSRIGFEATNHYFYVPVDLAEKVLNCRYLLDHWLAGPP
jgi:hypothetical protein